MEAVKKKGADSITDDFMAEAERLSAEKRVVALERPKLQVDIQFRESVVADKQVIADALVRFESAVKRLPPDDQEELIQLIIREISVNQFDPKTDPIPQEKSVFITQIRTTWYSVNISLFQVTLYQIVTNFVK